MNAVGLPTLYYTSIDSNSVSINMAYKLFIYGDEGEYSIGIKHIYVDVDELPVELNINLGRCEYQIAYLKGQELWDAVKKQGGMTSIEMKYKKKHKKENKC